MTGTVLLVLTPAEQAQVFDTWTTTGLRGTGSQDDELHAVFVPTTRTLKRAPLELARYPGALYACWARCFLRTARALGVARAALGQVKPTRSAAPHLPDRVVRV